MTSADLERLVKILELMRSDYSGERDNAARMASDLVHASGSTWEQVLNPDAELESAAIAAARVLVVENEELRRINERLHAEVMRLRHSDGLPGFWYEPADAPEAILQAKQWPLILDDWEQGFIQSLAGRRQHDLSEKQMNRLAVIVMKIKRHARAKGIAT